MKLEFSRQIFEKYSKFHENLSIGSRHVPCGRRDGQTVRRTDGRSDGRTDMTELIAPFRNSRNGPKKRPVMTLQGKVAVCSEIDKNAVPNHATLLLCTSYLGNLQPPSVKRYSLSLCMENWLQDLLNTKNTLRDFRFPPRCRWDLRSSGLLRSVDS